ncbi:MAG TPA: hypothetical protein DGG94_22010 [Micromonosporaceae bacterium]|nr:hypothetical protein [Micromonosporaceae bacterium]HCU52434.1 hypothetical protein [Micromonosporaceae bacterium]
MRRFLAWQRERDFLKELYVFVLIALAGTAVATAIGLFDLVTGAPIHTPLFLETQIEPPLPAGVTADIVSEVGVEIAKPTERQRLLYGLTQAPTALLLLVVFGLLARTLHRARRSDPFTSHTVRSLRWIGLALLAGLTAGAVEGWARLALTETISPDRWGATVDLRLAWLFGGFLCFAIAEIVKRGCDMRDELNAVI